MTLPAHHLLAVALAGLAALLPARAEDGEAGRCTFRAWSSDRDPAGTNVRAAPSAAAPIVGRLPAVREHDGELFAVEMSVRSVRAGWVEIDRAAFEPYGDGRPDVVFRGRGWVSGRLVAFDVGDQRVRWAPSLEAEVVDRAVGEDFLQVHRLVGCRGPWAEIEGEFRGADDGSVRPTRGWVTGICANQVTTCP